VGGEAGVYSVPLHVGFEDRPGLLAAVTQAAAAQDANIRSCHASTHEDTMGIIDLVVEVRGGDISSGWWERSSA